MHTTQTTSITRKVQPQSTFFSDLGQGADDLVDVVSSLIPGNIVGDLLGGILDKPADSVNPMPYVRKDQQYLNHARNIENLDKLQIDPAAQQLCDDEHFGTKQPETDLMTLFKKPTYLQTFQWHTTDPAGTLLGGGRTGPMDDFLDGRSFEVPQDLCLLSYLSNNFQYWRGGIRLIFQIISSSFHEGRLDIENHPGVALVPTDLNASASQYMTSYTLRNTNNELQVIIPFESDVPWKSVYRGETLSDVRTDGDFKFTDYFTGCWALRVSSPLKAPSTVIPSVEINVFIAGADDFEVNYLGMMGQSIIPVELTTPSAHTDKIQPKKITRKVQKQSGEESKLDDAQPDLVSKEGVGLAEQVAPLPISQVLASPSFMETRARGHLGESPWDLNRMLNRFNFVGTYPWNMTDTLNTSICLLDVVADLLNNPNASMPFHRFIYWRCSVIKIRLQLTASRFHQGQLIAAFIPSQRSLHYFNQYYSSARLASLQSCFLNPAGGTTIDFEIPFVFYKGWVDLLNGDTLGQFNVQVFNVLQAVTGASTSVALKVFVSIEGSEFKIPRPGTTTWSDIKKQPLPQGTSARKVVRQSGEEATPKAMAAAPPSKTQGETAKVSVVKKKLPFSMNSNARYSDETAIVLAPSRCRVYDGKARHFGEKYTCIREFCKRYFPLLAQVVSVPSEGPDYHPYLFNFPGFCPSLVSEQTPIMRWLTMFRNFRGPLNYKIRVLPNNPAGITDFHGFVTFLGDYYNSSYLANFPESIITQNPRLLGSNVPRAYFSNTQTAEIQVPFLSQNSTRLIAHVGDNIPTYDNIFDDNFALCVFIANNTTAAQEFRIEIHFAFGDETHIGTFMGTPIIKGQTIDPDTVGSAAPDSWVVMTPPPPRDNYESVFSDTE